MNIHFDDKTLFFQLMDSALVTIPIGSAAYGLQNEKSDSDYIVIYAESIENEHTFNWTHHQLQYTGEEGCDYMFMTLKQYIQNLLKGDQTILYEAVSSTEMRESKNLGWLYKLWEHKCFSNYTVSRSYLGFAKRDIKTAHNMLKGVNTVFDDKLRKKLSHAYRSAKMGERVKHLAYSGSITFGTKLEAIYQECGRLKDGTSLVYANLTQSTDQGTVIIDKSHVHHFLEDLQKAIDKDRENLNLYLEQKEIARYATVGQLQIIDTKMKEFIKSDIYKFKQRRNIDYGDIFYKALEEDVRYTKK